MKTVSLIQIIVGMTIIALAGIAVVVIGDASLSSVQSVSATTDLITDTTVGGEEEETGATASGNTTTTNTDSNVTLGNLFYIGRTIEETFNPINETYFVLSFVESVTLMPPNATDVVINATGTGNLTIDVQPNGLSIYEGQIFITAEDGGGGQEENAAATFASLARTDTEGTTGSATGVMFFSTDSTGQLAFLNNMVGISQLEFSPEEATIKIWEWKGGSLAPKNGSGGAATTGNQSTAPES
jgi:hypothetical protein